MNSLRDTIAFNGGVKKRQEIINENCNVAKKEILVMQRVLSVVNNFIEQVEGLKNDLNTPYNTRGMYYGANPSITPPDATLGQEEMSEIKKKAYELLMNKMKIAEEVINETFGVHKEEKHEEEHEEEKVGEEW